MADELENESIGEEETSENTTEEAIKPKKTSRLFKKIPIVAGMIVVQFIVAYILLTRLSLPNPYSEENPQPNIEVADSTKENERPKLFLVDEPEVDDLEAAVFTLDDIVINPAGSRTKTFFVLSLVFMIKEKDGFKEVEKREPAIKDRVLSLLCRKTAQWLSKVDNRDILRNEIKLIVNRQLVDTQVTKVYFTKYVLQ